MEQRVLYRESKPLPLAVALAFAAAAYLIVRVAFGNHDSWRTVIAFAGILALGLILGARRKALAARPMAALDANGLTVPLSNAGVGAGSPSIVVPWSNVAGASMRYFDLSRTRVGYVVVSVRNLDEFLATLPENRRDSARRAVERDGAPINLIKARDISPDELIALVDGYRDKANGAIAPA
jgi:hypothetical protein